MKSVETQSRGEAGRQASAEAAKALGKIKNRVNFIARSRGVSQAEIWASLVAPVVNAEFDKCIEEPKTARKG